MEQKIATMADDISQAIGKTLLEMFPRLTAKYEADGSELASAIIAGHIMLLSGAVAGVLCGPDAGDAKLTEVSGKMATGIHEVIKLVTELHSKPDA
jgi:hypothetical protein